MSQKPVLKKEKHQWLFLTKNINRFFVFVCVLSLLQAKSKEGISMIRTSLQNEGVITHGKMLNGETLRKILNGWSRIQKLFKNSFNAKPQALLGECMNDFPQEFIVILQEIIVSKRVSQLKGKKEITENQLAKLVDIIKISLTYFEFQDEKVKLLIKSGTHNKNFNIGYLLGEDFYVVVKEIPKKPKSQTENKILEKMSQISIELLKMYEKSDLKIKNLEIVRARQAESKAKSKSLRAYKSHFVQQVYFKPL